MSYQYQRDIITNSMGVCVGYIIAYQPYKRFRWSRLRPCLGRFMDIQLLNSNDGHLRVVKEWQWLD